MRVTRPLRDPRKEIAAQAVAEGRLEFGEIAKRAEVDVRTLHRWRHDVVFAARVERISIELCESSLNRAIRRKEYRVKVLADTLERLLQVVEERAADPAMADIAGGTSGLLVKQFKVSGETVVPEYAVDTGTIREIRAVQEQVAKELGQLVDKSEAKVEATFKDERTMTDAELRDEIQKLGTELYGTGWPGSPQGAAARGKVPPRGPRRKRAAKK